MIEKNFEKYKVKVANINYAYNIEDLYKCNKDMQQLTKWKAMYRKHGRAYLKENKMSISDFK